MQGSVKTTKIALMALCMDHKLDLPAPIDSSEFLSHMSVSLTCKPTWFMDVKFPRYKDWQCGGHIFTVCEEDW